jgi:murein DD-endopeptidase MepM/ murein hydrolase activator NlpD
MSGWRPASHILRMGRLIKSSLAAMAVLMMMSCASAPDPSTNVASGLPHGVLVVDRNGRTHHLHVAPIVENGRFTSGFGRRSPPMGGGSGQHKGIDVAAPKGTPVRAAAGGIVAEAGWRGSYGRFIRIRHGGGLETAYAHLSRFARGMKVGRRVRQDDLIGYVGTTGRSTGPHLHYEVRRNGKPHDPLGFPAAKQGPA